MIKEESLSYKFVHRGKWLYIFTFLGAPLGYIIKIILSHDLSQNDFGIFYGIISLIILFSAINDLGCTESLNYLLPKYTIKKQYHKVRYLLSFVFKIQIFTSLAIILGILLFADWIAVQHFQDIQASNILKVISLFFLGNNLLQICVTVFSATQNTKLQKLADFIRLCTTTLFVVGVFLLDFGNLLTYTWMWILGLLIAVIFAGYFFYKEYYQPYLQNVTTDTDPVLKKEFVKYAIPAFFTANITLLFSQIDSQLIIKILGNDANATYSNYLSIISLPFLVLSPIIGFLFPVFSELYARNQTEKITTIYKNMTLYLVILSIWITAFFFQSGEHIAKALFGEKYILSGIILQFSVPFLIFNILNSLNFQLLSGTGNTKARTISSLIILPVNIILNIWLIHALGVQGSALAVGLSWIPLYLMTLYFSRNFISMPPILPIIKNLIIASICVLCSYYSILFFQIQNSFIIVLILSILYAICFLTFNYTTLKNGLKIIKSSRS